MANGLLNTPQRSETYASDAPTAPADDTAEGEGGEQPNVSPEEQAQYDQFVANGMKLIFNEKVAPALIQRLQADPNPIHGLAATSVMIVSKLVESARQNGKEIDPDVIMHGGTEIMSSVAELAKAAKIHDFTPDEQEKAFYAAADMYTDQQAKNGTLDKRAFARDAQTLIQADKAGKLDEVLPGASEAAAKYEKTMPAGQEAAPEEM
jgi:hypothetical protein